MSGNKKRLAINTIILYLRMIVVMCVSFYTTRVVLRVLGVVDFGLVNAIGGVVSMFSFVSATLSTACSRYFSFEIGRQNYVRLNQLFSLILFLFVCLAIFLVLSTESVGLWYLRNKLVLPPERMHAAFWFFQFTILTVVVGWLSVPYSSMAVSFENMSLFSWLSVLDAMIKLVIALIISWVSSYDKLIFYGGLLFAGAVVSSGLYMVIVRAMYSACRFKWYFNKSDFREICVFGGWNFFGVFIWMTSDAFVNLLLNSFFGPVVNAARGVAMQVNHGVAVFTTNFLTAARPQIVKLWASGNVIEAWRLYKSVSKGGYFLVFVFAVPLCFELPFVLSLWLGSVPEYTLVFTRLVVVTTVLNTFSHPAAYLMQAVGRMGLFEGIGSGVRIFIFPVSYLLLRGGSSPDSVFYVSMVFTIFCVGIRIGVLFRVAKLSSSDFIQDVIIRLAIASCLCIGLVALVNYLMLPGWCRLLACCVMSGIVSTVLFFFVALNHYERMSARNLAKDIIRKFRVNFLGKDVANV